MVIDSNYKHSSHGMDTACSTVVWGPAQSVSNSLKLPFSVLVGRERDATRLVPWPLNMPVWRKWSRRIEETGNIEVSWERYLTQQSADWPWTQFSSNHYRIRFIEAFKSSRSSTELRSGVITTSYVFHFVTCRIFK